MEDRDLAVLVTALKAKHPDVVNHLRTLAAAQGTPVAASATAIMQFLLQQFDEREQLQWQLRDLLVKQPKFNERGQSDYYWRLKYGAVEMVRRIHAAGGFDDCNVEWPLQDYTHE